MIVQSLPAPLVRALVEVAVWANDDAVTDHRWTRIPSDLLTHARNLLAAEGYDVTAIRDSIRSGDDPTYREWTP